MIRSCTRAVCSALVCCTLVVSLLGCGRADEEPKSVLGPSSEQAMKDLKAMLEQMEKEKQPMPRGVQDLTAFGPAFPAAEVFLQNGAITYAWGTKISTAGAAAETVIAFESNADKEGGFVLMQDGNIKKMTAEEFNAAKYAGKKPKSK